MYTNPAAVRAQAEEHARHADELREVLDGVLEVGVLGGPGRREGRGLETVNLGPVFMRIGATLKRHCAPMRDRRVDAMVAAAGEGGAHAFGAVRMCLELLELMKLVSGFYLHLFAILFPLSLCESANARPCIIVGYCQPPTSTAPPMASAQHQRV